MLPSNVRDWLVESFYRLTTKSPKFVMILSMIFALLSFAGKIPIALDRWFGITAGEHFVNICNDISKTCMGGFLGTLFAAKPTLVAQTDNGKAVMVSDEKKMPFTSKAEKKDVDKAMPPPPVAPDVPDPEEITPSSQ